MRRDTTSMQRLFLALLLAASSAQALTLTIGPDGEFPTLGLASEAAESILPVPRCTTSCAPGELEALEFRFQAGFFRADERLIDWPGPMTLSGGWNSSFSTRTLDRSATTLIDARHHSFQVAHPYRHEFSNLTIVGETNLVFHGAGVLLSDLAFERAWNRSGEGLVYASASSFVLRDASFRDGHSTGMVTSFTPPGGRTTIERVTVSNQRYLHDIEAAEWTAFFDLPTASECGAADEASTEVVLRDLAFSCQPSRSGTIDAAHPSGQRGASLQLRPQHRSDSRRASGLGRSRTHRTTPQPVRPGRSRLRGLGQPLHQGQRVGRRSESDRRLAHSTHQPDRGRRP